MKIEIFLPKKIICPDCGNRKFSKENGEVYCRTCGLIVNENDFVNENHTWETSHEPLSDGLSLKSEMADIERKNNYKSSSKNKYDKTKSRYYDLLESKLLDLGFNLSECLDIFNYCFMKYYVIDTNSNAFIVLDNGKKKQRTQEELVEDFLESERFECFDVKASVSKLKNQHKILGDFDNVRIIP